MIMESVRKMKVKEQEAFDIGYLNGYEQGRRDAVEAAPVVYGEWGEWEHGGGHYCTVCGKDSLCDGVEEEVLSNFCPNCGAKMGR